MKKETPLNRQYNQIKNKYPGTILLFRLGDFFETFNDDAVITAKVCGITLTKRNNGAAGEIPLAGFPHHQLDAYLPKLVRAGHRVAVCEQLEDPKKSRGIVKRDVVEVVTPGVALYDKLLDSKSNNFAAAVYIKKDKKGSIVGVAAADVSTGEFFCSETPIDGIKELLQSLAPAEIIYSKDQKSIVKDFIKNLSEETSAAGLEEWIFDEEFAREALLGHFKTQNLKGFGIENFSAGIIAAGAVLHYINETQKSSLPHLKNISVYNPGEFMTLDFSTRRNLEILFTASGSIKGGTLISVIDKTCTAMGGRLLKKWISRPLRRLKPIHARLEAVKAFFESSESRRNIREHLSGIGDIERLTSKICTNRANPRDIAFLKQSLQKIPHLKSIISELNVSGLNILNKKLKNLAPLVNMIDLALVEEPSAAIGTGNIFKESYSKDLDSFVNAKINGKNWIASFQEQERSAFNIPSLKVSFNNVFGYYIDITNAHKKKVPEHYERKQTLTNSERYTTKELKEFEAKILNAEEKISELENELFNDLKLKINEYVTDLQENAYKIAAIDCLQGFAEAASEYNYTHPDIDESDSIDIKGGRHPVVERLLPIGENFIPNNTFLNSKELIHIITGPNMSGKSCYLRQTALIILLGQIGSYVPAASAKFGIIDRIFTRVGAQDNITSGESTFLVEMQEAANIMNNATSSSLILLDEVGRGTATFDGISIAWAIAEHIHNNIRAKTLFATHYHELNDMAERYENIINYKVDVIQTSGQIVFTHNVKLGATDHSFGIHVARMAGIPYAITERAREIMRSLESYNNEDDNSDNNINDKNISENDNNKIKNNNNINNNDNIKANNENKLKEEPLTPLNKALRDAEYALNPTDTALKRPENALKRPENALKRPESALKRPESALKRPESALKRPESALKYIKANNYENKDNDSDDNNINYNEQKEDENNNDISINDKINIDINKSDSDINKFDSDINKIDSDKSKKDSDINKIDSDINKKDFILKKRTPAVSEIVTKKKAEPPEQLSIFEMRDDRIREELKAIDVNSITPVEALNILSKLVKKVKG